MSCIDEVCIPVDSGTSGNDTTASASATQANSSAPTTSASTTTTDGSSGPTTGGPTTDADTGTIKLDVGSNETDTGPTMGCQAIDMLFAIDGSASMAEERNALAATNAFTQVVSTLEGLNGGGIDFRIGVTDDNDHGFLVPNGWAMADPWFDSQTLTTQEIANAFNGAVGQVAAFGGASLGCEHVLTSGTTLIDNDVSGFVRDDALLVLVLLSDVDDYGAYDQEGGNSCGIGCATAPPALQTLLDTLVAAKNGQTEGVAAIVVAGDPSLDGGVNLCEQPGSCGCGGFDCAVFHADRLYAFTDLVGTNGYAADLCSGPASVPTAVETALNDSIELACVNFEPEG
jgi:hypothetical protein